MHWFHFGSFLLGIIFLAVVLAVVFFVSASRSFGKINRP